MALDALEHPLCHAHLFAHAKRLVHQPAFLQGRCQHALEIVHILVGNEHELMRRAIVHQVGLDAIEMDQIQGLVLFRVQENIARQKRLFHHLLPPAGTAHPGRHKVLHAKLREPVPDGQLRSVTRLCDEPICLLLCHGTLLKLLPADDAEESEPKYLQIEPDGVVPQIIQVQVQPCEHLVYRIRVTVVQGSITGHPGTDLEQIIVPCVILLDLVDEVSPFGSVTYEGHIAFEDVP